MWPLFKVTFQEVKEGELVGNQAYFYVNGLDTVLDAEYYNTKFNDVKSGDSFTLKESILKQLENKDK